MARWRLTGKHYLHVPEMEWMYEETDRNTGKRARKIFQVPRYLDPDNPSDQTPHGSGELIVAHEGKGHSSDVIFIGDPTPEMEPLDEEAETITAECRQRWENPIDSLPAQGLSGAEKAFVDAFTKIMDRQNVSATEVKSEDFEKLKEQVAALAARNAELEAALSGADGAKPARRA